MAQGNAKKLYRTNTNRMFLGVLGGLAEYFNIDATILRLGFIVFVVLTGFFPGVLLYFLAAIVMPEKSA